MSKNKNIKIILDAIKEHYKFKTNTEFAEFLGIKPSSLSSWYSRNTLDYDLVFSKCEGVNANWLMTGEGSVFNSSNYKYNEEASDQSEKNNLNEAAVRYENNIDYRELYLRDLEKQIALLREDLKQKSEIIQGFLDGKISKMNQ